MQPTDTLNQPLLPQLPLPLLPPLLQPTAMGMTQLEKTRLPFCYIASHFFSIAQKYRFSRDTFIKIYFYLFLELCAFNSSSVI